MREIEGTLTDQIQGFIDKNTGKVVNSPPYDVNGFRKLVEETAQLSYLNKDYLLFYRGQPSDFQNKAGSSSFYPTIYRGNYLTNRELTNRFDTLNGSCDALVESVTNQNGIFLGIKDIKRKKYIQWSILQHYEVCETPLLDLTQSLRVACSFAQMDNQGTYGYIYVFGLPYLTNRISINSEQDLINIRLLSICPPQALRPYFQEGFLAGTDDITTNYDDKNELDFNRRLIAKFKIPNNESFWGNNYHQIPKDSLYPDNDPMMILCKDIESQANKNFKKGDFGEFLKLWSELEQKIIQSVMKTTDRYISLRQALMILYQKEKIDIGLYNTIDLLRRYRNMLVHKPQEIKEYKIGEYYYDLKKVIDKVNMSNI